MKCSTFIDNWKLTWCLNLCLAVSGDMTIILAASKAVLPAKALNAGLSGEIILFWITFQMEDVSRMSCFQTTAAQQIQTMFSHFVGFCVTKPALHCILCSVMLNGPQKHSTTLYKVMPGTVWCFMLLLFTPFLSWFLSNQLFLKCWVCYFIQRKVPFYLCPIVFN